MKWQESDTKWEEFEEKHAYRSYSRWSHGLTSLEWTDWIWEDHDKLEVIITPRYLKELTCSSWEPSKKREEREVEKEEDLSEMIMYLVFCSWWWDDDEN